RPSPDIHAATAPALRPPGMPPAGAAKASAHSSTSPPTPRRSPRSPLSASLLPAARAPGLLHRDRHRLLLRVALAAEFADVVADGLPRRSSLKWHGLTPPLAGQMSPEPFLGP